MEEAQKGRQKSKPLWAITSINIAIAHIKPAQSQGSRNYNEAMGRELDVLVLQSSKTSNSTYPTPE